MNPFLLLAIMTVLFAAFAGSVLWFFLAFEAALHQGLDTTTDGEA